MDSILKRDLILVFVLALAARLAFAWPQTQPGYMDAYYYTVGAQQLAAGRGFTEPFIWNYLDDPQGLPRPSHQYWMPLPSILAALAMWMFGASFRVAQSPFVILSALLAVVAYGIAWQTSHQRRHAWAAALFVVFSGFYVPVWSLPETFAPFAVLGAACLWASGQGGWWGLIAGACAGLAHLTRADGALLLLPALLIGPNRSVRWAWPVRLAQVVLGYALVMTPWLWHNLAVVGRPLSIAGTQTLFLTSYDDLYSLGKTLDLSSYLAWGMGSILRSKLDALWANLLTLVAVDGLVFLAPLAAVGFWQRRRDPIFRAALLYGAALYLVMSLAFTFPGMRGGMFHSSAALLPFIFAAALAGLDAVVDWVAARCAAWDAVLAKHVFTWGLVALAALTSVMIYSSRVRAWNQADAVYAEVGRYLADQPAPVVLVNNPPGYVYHTGQSAIAIPNGGVDTLIAAAHRYGAAWVMLEANHPQALKVLYNRPASDDRLVLMEAFVGGGRPVYLLRVRGSP